MFFSEVDCGGCGDVKGGCGMGGLESGFVDKEVGDLIPFLSTTFRQCLIICSRSKHKDFSEHVCETWKP
jgi:hypothetical protein